MSAVAPTGESLAAVWDDLRGALSDRAELLTLELRLAGLSLAQLVIYAVIVAVLVISAWLGVVAGLVVGVVGAGLHWAVALAAGVVLNLGIAAWLVVAMVRIAERVGLPASLRSLEGKGPRP